LANDLGKLEAWLLAAQSKETGTSKSRRSARYGRKLQIWFRTDPRRVPTRQSPDQVASACLVSFLLSQTVMADDQHVVYLEDVETTALSTPNAENVSVTPSASQNGSVKAAVKTTEATGVMKRQRTLMDMLSGPPNGNSAEPAAKKLKLAASSSNSGSAKIAVGGVSVQRLNAIPFSLSQYTDSIPEDHRHLLKLECECMGKSWCVRRSHNNSSFCF
jgi:hypothetical protein